MRRRRFLAAAASAAAALPIRLGAAARPRVVVVGGGFSGASCARALARTAACDVTLVEAAEPFTACPGSNAVIAGLRELSTQEFGYDVLRRESIAVIRAPASAVDSAARVVVVDGKRIPYDRLVIAPGIAMRWGAVQGYDEAAAARMPHAWLAGEQTLLLRRQLEAMPEGGVVVIAAPAYPYRCPTAPYERASLVAHYLAARKPRAKLLVLDAKDGFSQQRLFEQAWQALYPGRIEWVALSQGGAVVRVDAATNSIETDFEKYQPAVANIIPPQKAGRIAELAGVADATGWCPIHPETFESRLESRIHVIGDAAIAGAMPKSAFSANSQGKACAAAIAALLADRPPSPSPLAGGCYNLAGPGYGISLTGAYRASGGQLREVEGSQRTSELEAPRVTRAREAERGEAWLRAVTRETFG